MGNDKINNTSSVIIITIFNIYNLKPGFSSRSLLNIYIFEEAYMELLNQFHPKSAQNTKPAYPFILRGITYVNIKIKTDACSIGNIKDHNIPKYEPLNFIFRSLFTR